MLPITALFAALLAPLCIALSARVILARRSEKVGVGDGGSVMLLRRARAHGNFAEYVPYTLVLLGLAENLQSPVWLLHASGALLVFGRIIHATGISQTPEPMKLRVAGTVCTFTVLGVLAVVCLWAAVRVLM
jgi:uncharacterized protein